MNILTTVQIDSTVENYQAISTLFNSTTEGCTYLKWIAKSYWDVLKATSVGGVYGDKLLITIAPDGTGQNIPSGINFQFKPYGGTDVVAGSQDQRNLTTLNYPIMQNGKHLPSPCPAITWDWMSKAEDVDNDGVVAIANRNVLDSVIHFFSPYLDTINKMPYVYFHDDNSSKNTYINILYGNDPNKQRSLSIAANNDIKTGWDSPENSDTSNNDKSWSKAKNKTLAAKPIHQFAASFYRPKLVDLRNDVR